MLTNCPGCREGGDFGHFDCGMTGQDAVLRRWPRFEGAGRLCALALVNAISLVVADAFGGETPRGLGFATGAKSVGTWSSRVQQTNLQMLRAHTARGLSLWRVGSLMKRSEPSLGIAM